MIVVHELAHLKEREHGKAFYALCLHMEPDYHQLEFDLRLWLTAQELTAQLGHAPPKTEPRLRCLAATDLHLERRVRTKVSHRPIAGSR